MPDHADLLPGTLDLLILKAASLGPLHGCDVLPDRTELVSANRQAPDVKPQEG